MLRIDFWNIVFTLINILVLYAFMRHFLIGPVRKIIEDRKNTIENDLDGAATAKKDAVQMKQQYEASMKEAKANAAVIMEDARAKAKKEYDQILAQAKEDADRKLKEAEKTIAMARKEAMDSLSSSVAGLAMTAAAKLLAEQSGPERDRSVYDSFLKKAGEGK